MRFRRSLKRGLIFVSFHTCIFLRIEQCKLYKVLSAPLFWPGENSKSTVQINIPRNNSYFGIAWRIGAENVIYFESIAISVKALFHSDTPDGSLTNNCFRERESFQSFSRYAFVLLRAFASCVSLPPAPIAAHGYFWMNITARKKERRERRRERELHGPRALPVYCMRRFLHLYANTADIVERKRRGRRELAMGTETMKVPRGWDAVLCVGPYTDTRYRKGILRYYICIYRPLIYQHWCIANGTHVALSASRATLTCITGSASGIAE